MNAGNLLFFAGTLLAIAIVPGPNNTVILARSLARDRTGAVLYALGVGVGDLIMLSAAFWGISALSDWLSGGLDALKWFGVGYILILACQVWRSRNAVPVAASRSPGLAAFGFGMMGSVANPHGVLFYMALVPGIMGGQAHRATDFAVLVGANVAVLCVVWVPLIILGDWLAHGWGSLSPGRIGPWILRSGGLRPGALRSVAAIMLVGSALSIAVL